MSYRPNTNVKEEMERTYSTLSNYCSGKEFITALQNISEDISVVNLPPIPRYEREDPGITIASLINTIWTLLQHRQQFVDDQYDLQQNIYTVSQDLNYCKDKLKKLEKNLHDVEESLREEKKKAILLQIENSEMQHNSNSLMQEIKQLKHQIKHKDIQFKHDLQRQNNEISDLQSKLRRILSKERGETWRGPVENSSTCTPHEDKKTNYVELLYQKSVHRLENNVHTLVKENLELRKLLENVSEDLAQLMSQTRLQDCEKRVT